MNTGILLASAIWLLFQPMQSNGPISEPLRNTFVVGTETVIDNASAINLTAGDEVFDGQMKQLKLSKDNLAGMAANSREKDIVDDASHLIFLISACHIQAKNGADPARCKSQFSTARNRMMEAINKHKSGGTWADGPPSSSATDRAS